MLAACSLPSVESFICLLEKSFIELVIIVYPQTSPFKRRPPAELRWCCALWISLPLLLTVWLGREPLHTHLAFGLLSHRRWMNHSVHPFVLHELQEEIRYFVTEVSVFSARTQRVYLICVKDLSAFIIMHFKIFLKYFNCCFIYVLVFPEKLSSLFFIAFAHHRTWHQSLVWLPEVCSNLLLL